MSIAVICEQARRAARESVRNGEWTERGLARLAGVSQPHMHNVLKGVRSLSIKLADRILCALDIQVGDLLDETDGASQTVPLMCDALGSCPEFRPHLTAGHVRVPARFASAADIPVAAFVGDDHKLPGGIAAGDIAVILQGARICSTVDPRVIYVVLTARGPRVRHVHVGLSGQLFVSATAFVRVPSEWEPICDSDAERSSAICGRVIRLTPKPVLSPM